MSDGVAESPLVILGGDAVRHVCLEGETLILIALFPRVVAQEILGSN